MTTLSVLKEIVNNTEWNTAKYELLKSFKTYIITLSNMCCNDVYRTRLCCGDRKHCLNIDFYINLYY